jgi:hypothetical protein
MAKIIKLPTLSTLIEHQQAELLNQLFVVRDKINNVVDLVSSQHLTKDSHQRLHNEMMAMDSMLTDAGESLRSAYTRKK